jgi:hypothetical protein
VAMEVEVILVWKRCGEAGDRRGKTRSLSLSLSLSFALSLPDQAATVRTTHLDEGGVAEHVQVMLGTERGGVAARTDCAR